MRTHTSLWALAVLALAQLGGWSLRAGDTEPVPARLSKEDIARAEKAVKAHLEKIRGEYGQVTHIAEEAVARALPGIAFFHVLYRQFPVGRTPPAGLKESNLFVVGRDGKMTVLTDARGLEKLFKERLLAASSEERLKDAARAWVRLGQEFHQDGFYRFKAEDDSTKVAKAGEGRSASARAVVMLGGNGSYSAELTFSAAGKLVAVKDKAELRPGPRPICQATKLLDPDPIVRAMAEQALLCMGRAAKGYLEEQKAKASPELKRAIERIWQRICASDR